MENGDLCLLRWEKDKIFYLQHLKCFPLIAQSRDTPFMPIYLVSYRQWSVQNKMMQYLAAYFDIPRC